MKKFLLLCAMLFAFAQVWAQERTISGTVTSDEGEPLPGVNVVLKGTNKGAVTDFDGNYKLSVPSEGGTLIFSFIGLKTQEVEIGSRSVVDLTMTADVTQLNEIVVTALNVPREKKTLGYAVQEVKEENLRVARETDVNQALAGKIAGVQVISGSGAKFGTAAVRIRGIRGLSGSDPLYVLDGVVVNDISAINMDNIQSVNVLKGANAAALYGLRARDGVVMLTSKQGKEGVLTVDVRNSTFFENVSVLPDYQNEYGGGYSQTFQTFDFDPTVHDPALSGLDGQPMAYFAADESWGPRLDGRQVAQWDAFVPGTEGYGQTRPWSANPDNVRNFFETGTSINNSLSIGKGGEGYNIRATVTDIRRNGILPGSEQDRFFLNLNSTIDLTDKLQMVALSNYSKTNTTGNLFEGYNSIGSNFNQWFQRQLDMDLLERYWRLPDGSYSSWNLRSATNTRPLYWDNPYTMMYANFSNRETEVFSGKFGLSYDIMEDLKLTGNFTREERNFWMDDRIGSGTLDLDQYRVFTSDRREDNLELIAQYNTQVSDDFSVGVLAGGNVRYFRAQNQNLVTNGGLAVPDLYTIGASVDRPTATNSIFEKEVRSMFVSANVGYLETFFLDGTYRADWVSALANTDDNLFGYKMLSGSVVFSEFFPNSDFLTFGKVRGSIAEGGQEIDAYADNLTFPLGTPYGSYPAMSVPNSVPAFVDGRPALEAAVTTAYEAGIETRFLNSRINLDLSYFFYDNTNEIIDVTVASTSGVSRLTDNSGRTTTKGWELALGGSPIRSGDFNWDIMFNFASFENTIEELNAEFDLEALTLGNGFRGTSTSGGWGGIQAKAEVGGEWGTIIGRKFRRDDAGNMVVDADGYPLYDDNQVLGSILPDYTGGIFNRLTYKNLELSFTMDWQIGGTVHSITNMFGAYSGLTEETVGNNDKGNPMRDAPSEGGGLTFGGVHEDGTPNTTYVSAPSYWKSQFALHERWIYDATYLKLREVRLGYRLPSSLLSGTFVKNASIAIVSNNTLLLYSDVPGIDPSEIGGDTVDARVNGAWVDSGNLPSTRTLGFDIKIGI
ncbi:MAG: SusC/RagA family TonB-linked outer membrane protein [Candidatus Cyclobacteriaceae bacterium M2_1C_046]